MQELLDLMAVPLVMLGTALITALFLGRHLGRLVHLGWVVVVAATVWMTVVWLTADGYGRLAMMVFFAYYLAPAALGWGLGAALGLRWRRRPGRPSV